MIQVIKMESIVKTADNSLPFILLYYFTQKQNPQNMITQDKTLVSPLVLISRYG